MKQTNKPVMDITSIKFAAFLEEALAYIDSYTPTDINSGGCGEFAELLSEELDKYNIPHKIYALFRKENTPFDVSLRKEYDAFIKEGKKPSNSPFHIVIYIEDTLYVDSTGIVNSNVLPSFDPVELTLEQVKTLNNWDIWNPVFDKGCDKFIKEQLDYIFSVMADFHSGMFEYPKERQIIYTNQTIRERNKKHSRNNPINSLLRQLTG